MKYMAKRNVTTTLSSYILPSDNISLQNFSRRHKVSMMDHIVTSIEYAIKNKLPIIEVFQFRDSDFVITISDKDFLSNLENIYSFCVQNELYEKCPKILELQKFLKNSPINETKTCRVGKDSEGFESHNTTT